MAAQAMPHSSFAVITGASSGIGYELARQFAMNGFEILITSKEPQRIMEAEQKLKDEGFRVESFAADLTQPGGVEALYDKIQSSGKPLDAIAINAGVGVYGEFKDTPWQEELNLLNLNVVSAVHLAKLAVRNMAARGEGRILFTSSIAGTMPGPLTAVYNASKAFLFSFSEALREELADTNVNVTALLPGATDTSFFERAGMEESKLNQMNKQSPREVAEVGFKALMADKDHVVSGLSNKAQVALGEILPESVKAKRHHNMAKPDPETQH